MHEVLVNRLGGLSLPRKSVVRLTDRPDMTLDVYRGRKTTIQQQQPFSPLSPSLWETARYRLKYCLKGPLKPNNQPTNLLRPTVSLPVLRILIVN